MNQDAETQLTYVCSGRNEALQYIGQLESSHSWLVAEKESFGVKGGEFDFSSRDPKVESILFAASCFLARLR